MAVCINCGKEITAKPHKKGSTRKFCGFDCYEAYREKSKRKFDKAFYKYCGKVFNETRDRPNTFCSKKCSGKYQSIIQLSKKYSGHTLISDDLQNELKELIEKQKELSKRIDRVVHDIKHVGVCEYCGREYIKKKIDSKYCSAECSKKATNSRKEKRLSKNGKPDYSITLPLVYAKNKGVCQICGRKINFDCPPNSNYYPSIDHTIPINHGGCHVWANVQLVCRICNSKKSDHIPPALDSDVP